MEIDDIFSHLHTFPKCDEHRRPDPANTYSLKVSNRNTRKRCGICSKLPIKIPERRRSDLFIIYFEHISHLFLVFLLLTLNK